MDKKAFKLGALFTSKTGDTDIKKEHINGEGYPVVSSGNDNTGILGCSDIEACIIPKNTITVDMFGNVYYRGFDYKMVTHARVFALLPNGFSLDEKTGLYFATSLVWLSHVFSYNNMCSYKKIKDMEIEIPVVESHDLNHEYTVEDIDFKYMKERIAELEKERIAELDAYLAASGLNDYELTDEDKEILSSSTIQIIKMFKVGELFDIHPTDNCKMKNDELFALDGTTPVLSNSSVNNGIGGYCGIAPTEQGEMITFSDTTTGADTMFYQSAPFIGYPHVQGMYPYQPNKWNEKCCLYVISCIRKSAGNGWSYAVKFNRARVKELFIELPVIESPDPDHKYTVDDIDFDYMERYIRATEKNVIADVVRYKDRVIEETKKIVDAG